MNNFIKKAIKKIQYIRKIITFNKKIGCIYRQNKKKCKNNYDKQNLSNHKEKWSILKKRINSKWFKIYSCISNICSADFVPEDIYYAIIEPIMNDPDFLIAFKDKNLYEKYYDKDLFPKTLIRNMDGVYYDREYNPLKIDDVLNNLKTFLIKENKIIVKPTISSGGGTNVHLFERIKDSFVNSNHEILSVDYLEKNYKKNFIIQSYIDQHKYFKDFNDSSLNTVRIFTYRSVKTEEIIVPHAVQRIGTEGRFVDNQASGGISCGIDQDGKLNDFAVDKYGQIYKKSPSGLLFKEAGKVFQFKEMKEIAVNIAHKNLYTRLLGFDFCIDKKNQIKLIEINNKNLEINFHQMNNGPLFKDYTDEIIRYCMNYKSKTKH